jgi:hypothetical protein
MAAAPTLWYPIQVLAVRIARLNGVRMEEYLAIRNGGRQLIVEIQDHLYRASGFVESDVLMDRLSHRT